MGPTSKRLSKEQQDVVPSVATTWKVRSNVCFVQSYIIVPATTSPHTQPHSQAQPWQPTKLLRPGSASYFICGCWELTRCWHRLGAETFAACKHPPNDQKASDVFKPKSLIGSMVAECCLMKFLFQCDKTDISCHLCSLYGSLQQLSVPRE